MSFANRLRLQRPTNMSPQQLASTPTNRFFVPPFGNSSIPSYPRPGSSASKPNPHCLSFFEDPYSTGPGCYSEVDSMINNCGSSVGEDSFGNGDRSFQSPNSSAYYSCNESFGEPLHPLSMTETQQRNANTPKRFQSENVNTFQRFQLQFSKTFPGNHPQNEKTSPRIHHQNDNKFQKNFPNKRNFVKKKTLPKKMSSKVYNCSLCSITFNSGIPYQMHMKGLKHARKQKFIDAEEKFKQIAKESNDLTATTNSFRCELCDVQANSTLQFMNHLEGYKHQLKVTGATRKNTEPDIPNKEVISEKDTSKEEVIIKEVIPNEKGNSNCAVRSIEINSVQSRPTKCSRLACDACGIVVNSNIQLQQHLSSKKHQAKVERKTSSLPSIKNCFVPEKKIEEVGLLDTTKNITDESQK